ncbi:MAG: biotin/lipoyl-binding protein [Gemmataceae bacterium]
MFVRYSLPVIAMFTLVFATTQMTKAHQRPPAATPPVEPAHSPYLQPLAGAGLVEPETENISVGTHLAGVVDHVLVSVGDTVRSGQPLFHLDERQLKAELVVRQSMLAAAEASLAKLEMMPRPEELPPSKAMVAEAEANLKDQVTMYERIRKTTGSAFSDDELSRRQMAVEMAKAQLSKAKANLSLLEAGAWKADKLVSESAVRQARAQVEQTKTEIERLTVNAPILSRRKSANGNENRNGNQSEFVEGEFRVLQVNVRPGEFVGTTPGQALIVLGNVGRRHVRVDIDENDITRFKPGLKGVAKPRGNPKEEFPITFVRVEPYVIPKRSLTGASTERVDTRVLQVIYALDGKGQGLYVGQQMDVFLNETENVKDVVKEREIQKNH